MVNKRPETSTEGTGAFPVRQPPPCEGTGLSLECCDKGSRLKEDQSPDVLGKNKQTELSKLTCFFFLTKVVQRISPDFFLNEKQRDFRYIPEMSQTMSKLEQLKIIKDRLFENTCLDNNDFLESLITRESIFNHFL